MGILKETIEQNTTRGGRVLDITVQCLIIVSLVSFSIETLPDLSNDVRRLLRFVEIGTVAIFTIEYLLRIFVADYRLKFMFSFYGLVDLVAILPFYLATGLDLRSIRILRLLRLFRIFKLVRYSKAIQRFYTAFRLSKEELILFFMVATMLFFFAAVGIYYFENSMQPKLFASVFHSLWWAIITLTTVGYGDVYPMTVGGRIFTFFVLMVGLGVVAVPTAIIASALSEARDIESKS